MRTGFDSIRLKTIADDPAMRAMSLGRHRKAVRLSPDSIAVTFYELPIFTYNKAQKEIVLDLCGRWQVSVTRAQKDYAAAFGLDIEPSLKGGRYSVQFRGMTYHPGHDNQIRIAF